MDAVLVASAAATWGMVGVIWMVQLLQYPTLARASALEPQVAARDHARRITWIVGPLMAVEGVTALILLVERPEAMSVAAAWIAAALLGVALTSTALIQVPLHAALAEGHDDDVCRRLITTNWIRTVAWTARGLVLAVVLV
ncbi:MAG: hypothetical protein ACE367_17450 [Acidimicrobiales bacterium]